MNSREDPVRRRAGRAIVVGADGRVLMFRGQDPARPEAPGFWFTPGGGVEGDETIVEATRRELREEIGLDVGELGPVVMERVSQFRLEGTWYEQAEEIRVVRVPAGFEPTPRQFEELELAVITELRWLGLDEFEGLDEPHYPRMLVDLVRHIDAAGPPDPPWREISDGH